MTPSLELDHLVVGATTLEAGIDWVAERLGVTIPRGGRHAAMGTHNAVMQIGGGAYLEVIAVDPAGETPARPRWFDLDNPWVAGTLARGPRLLTWVARVNAPSILPGHADPCTWGEPIAMQRDRLQWRITVPADGRLPGGGFLPTLIEWQCEPPAPAMADTGCTLRRLKLRHRAAHWLRDRLAAIGALSLVEVEQAEVDGSRIEATIDSPAGRVTI